MRTVVGESKTEYMDVGMGARDGFYKPQLAPTVKENNSGTLALVSLNSGLIRFLDIILSVLAIIITFPIMVVVALVVKLDSRGPALFVQERLGQYKKPIKVFKFRTMFVDAEAGGAKWAQENDPRITRVGRFMRRSHLDELPQFFNVLMGEMSLVGPRPIRNFFAEQLASIEKTYDMRFLAKPGITGYAQIYSVYGSTVEDQLKKLEYDRKYLKGLTPGIYFKLLFLTVKTVLGAGGV